MNNGFYGSLSKIQKINFQFDRIFPNRAAMDLEAELDYYIAEGTNEKLPPVFIGRYVLVDYHEGDVIDKTVRIGYKMSNGSIVAAPGVLFDSGDDSVALVSDDIVTVIGEYNANEEYTSYNVPQMYRYLGNGVFNRINYTSNNNTPDNYTTYEKNLIIDGQQYTNIGRGWDSTVWQKTYQNGKATYIMIAELNAFNPTVTIAPEAPHLVPLNPYIGTDSTLDFYRIHMETPAGFRFKRSEMLRDKIETPRGTVTDFYHSTDTKSYPSDIVGDYAVAGNVYTKQPLAIYYNKKGMNKFISASNALEAVGENEQDAIKDGNKSKDSINFSLTGRSGKFYSNETSTPEVDMYEMSIMLPSLGESVSKIYDLAYGKNRYYNADGLHLYYKNPDITNVEGENGDYTSLYFTNEDENRGFRNTDIYWNSNQGIRAHKRDDAETTFDSEGLSTLAGVINSTHDLMGMIVRDYANLSLEENAVKDWDPTKIYFKNGKYYIKGKAYDWIEYTSEEVNENGICESAYEPIYILPEELQNEDGSLVEELASNLELETPKKYFVDIREGLYRESWEEYPTIPDTEVYDTDKASLFNTFYPNYIKVKNEDDLIDGAVYGVIVEGDPSQSVAISDFDPNKRYFYYDSSIRGLKGVYSERDNGNDSLKNKGIYYCLSDINLESVKINKFFYIPNVYYIKDNDTGITTRATKGSLQELIGSDVYSETNTQQSRYSFYSDAKRGQGTVTVEDPNKFELKYQAVPAEANQWKYENHILTIYQSDGETPVDEIEYEIYNGLGTIEFSDYDETPVGYWTKQYTNSEKKYYYTAHEIYLNGLDSNEYNIPKHDIMETNNVSTILIPDDRTKIANLIDFKENTYYYFRTPNIIVLEDMTHLMQQSGQERNKQLQYYDINWQSIRVMLQNAGGSYYKNEDGDYVLYPVLHMEDPTQDFLETLSNQERQERQPAFIPISEANNLRIFKPKVYYSDAIGSTKVNVLSGNEPLYERTGNIVGESEPIWADGMEWNDSIAPDNGHLGKKSQKWVAKEIKGMAKDFNTMYGLILKINQLLGDGDKYSRDSNTIRGILNQSQDTLTMLQAFGYSFSGIQVDDDVEHILEAQNAGAIVNFISNNSLINLKVEDGKLKFNETILHGYQEEDANIAYLNIGNPNDLDKNPQIIEYENEVDIEDYLESVENKSLAFNANSYKFYEPDVGSNTVTTVSKNWQYTPFLIDGQPEWWFKKISLTVDSDLKFSLTLENDSARNLTNAVSGGGISDRSVMISKNLTNSVEVTYQVQLEDFSIDSSGQITGNVITIPVGETSAVESFTLPLYIREGGSLLLSPISITFGANRQQETTEINANINPDRLTEGTLYLLIEDTTSLASMPIHISQVPKTIPNPHTLKIRNNARDILTISDYRITGPGSVSKPISSVFIEEAQNGFIDIYIDDDNIATWSSFRIPEPLTPEPRKIAEFTPTGKFKLTTSEVPTVNDSPVVIANQEMRMVWEPQVTEGANAHPLRLVIYSGDTPLVKIQAEPDPES